MKFFVIIIINYLLCSDQIPAAKQKNPILIQNATIYTISNGVLFETDILFDKGEIIEIGNEVTNFKIAFLKIQLV